MKILKIGIVHSDQKGQDTIANAFEDILLDEICAWVLMRKLQTAGEQPKAEATKPEPVVLQNEAETENTINFNLPL